ncbi:glycosyl hydrolase family 18 protein [Anaerovorax odorimutans]|uniref:glycosyl hydrolase family 18 protein n=1 Tax=Anaerovorax odorimutans TaxID=109327 RepID=UPI0003FDA987|nr:glycosyl hydrolase family 18 protein [Anaerovorax odorimutans]
MKKFKRLLIVALVIIISLVNVNFVFADESNFKVVGYYSAGLFDEPLDSLQIEKLTHVMYAFLIPKEDGSLEDIDKPDRLREIVEKGHENGTKVYISLGGWSYKETPLYTTFEKLASTEKSRANFIDNVLEFVNEYNLDGVEIDWEYPNENSIQNYESLVVELSKRLEDKGKHLTAALNGAWSATEGPQVSKLITDRCLDSFDFISVMAYDMNNEDHSPLWFANTSIDYWINRGVPKENIVIGVPLYARPSWLQYRHLVEQNRENAYVDYAETTPLKSYYNGLNTLREKTIIALRKAGGVMLFDVNEDTLDETSAVSMIDTILGRIKKMDNPDVSKYITVILNNRELVFDIDEGMGIPFIDENNRTLLPLRKPLEAIGAVVKYDEKNKSISVEKDKINIKVFIDKNEIYINENPTTMDTKAIIKDNRTYIPLRSIFEAFGYKVDWHNVSHTVYLDKVE